MDILTKTCIACGGEFVLNSFHKCGDRVSPECKECRRIELEKTDPRGRKRQSRRSLTHKECSKCWAFKPLSEFYEFKTGPSSWCKDCCCEKQTKSRREYLEGGKYFKSRANFTDDERSEIFREIAAKVNKQRDEAAKQVVIPDQKQCPGCCEVKLSAEFKRRSYNPDGLAIFCKKCEYETAKKGSEKRRVTKWWTLLLCHARRHNDKYPEMFDLTPDFLQELFSQQDGKCFWFGVPMVPTTERKHPQMPTIDRIDCTKGYSKDNVVLACFSANMGRNSSAANVFAAFVKSWLNRTVSHPYIKNE